MILPSAVTRDCKRARRVTGSLTGDIRNDKRVARRRYRRSLGCAVHQFTRDPERFESETFRVKLYTGWDIA